MFLYSFCLLPTAGEFYKIAEPSVNWTKCHKSPFNSRLCRTLVLCSLLPIQQHGCTPFQCSIACIPRY